MTPLLALALSTAAIDTQYLQRHQPGALEANIAALESATGSEHLWRLCRALIRRGERAKSTADFELARRHCEESVALTSTTADAHFWLGVAMARYGETKGVLKSLSLIKPIRAEMRRTLELDSGHGGAHQVLGQVLWKLPRLAGGDKKEALAEFEEAVRLSPKHTANYVPLAEALLHFGRREDAVLVLESALIILDPTDPAAATENLPKARAILESIRNE